MHLTRQRSRSSTTQWWCAKRQMKTHHQCSSVISLQSQRQGIATIKAYHPWNAVMANRLIPTTTKSAPKKSAIQETLIRWNLPQAICTRHFNRRISYLWISSIVAIRHQVCPIQARELSSKKKRSCVNSSTKIWPCPIRSTLSVSLNMTRITKKPSNNLMTTLKIAKASKRKSTQWERKVS